jgi:UDP-2,3-diacylglucosamine pyrophosphatase LpxH
VEPLEDVYIVSDLHLCEGWLREERRYSRLEVFFYDRELSRFVDHALEESTARGRTAKLLLNGDCFDFLAVSRCPSDEEADELGFKVTRREHKFGLASSEKKSVWKMERIIDGHPAFFAALARFCARGNRIVILRGNHDIELYWPSVQSCVADAIAAHALDEELTTQGDEIRERVEFRQWFYLERGRLYVEHGNQFDESNSFRYGLCPELPRHHTEDGEVGLDYPIGSLFVRFLYNKLKTVDPFGAYFVSLEQYVRLVGSYNFIDFVRVCLLHFPIFFRAIKGLRLFETAALTEPERLHRARRARLARNGIPEVDALDALVVAPAGKTKYHFFMELITPVLRGVFTFVGIGLVAILLWFFLFLIIQHQNWLAEGTFARASLMAVLAVLTFVGLFVAFTRLNRRLRGAGDPLGERLADRAAQIGEILDVPIVCFGHVHVPDYRRLRDGQTVYANSGTWIRNPGPWDQIKPRARQFTFLRVQEEDVELLRWDDSSGVAEPAPLLEGYHPSALERLLPETEVEAAEDGGSRE